MKKIVAYTLLTILSIGSISVVFTTQNNGLVKADDECVHSGFHYSYLNPTVENSGHNQFWTCCKCQNSFLYEPAIGTFIDQDDELMIGGLGKTHPAYISPLIPLTYNGHKYFPVPNGESSSDGIKFYDSTQCELYSNDSSYQMSDLANATYFSLKKDASFKAISFIECVAFEDIYQMQLDPGACSPKSSFLEEKLAEGELIESLTYDESPINVPMFNGESLTDIWNTFKDNGFAKDYPSFWSCVQRTINKAYLWDCYRSIWKDAPSYLSDGNSICLSKTFSFDEI